MSKKKKNKSGNVNSVKDYEAFQYGPIVLERAGRFVSIRANWGKEEFQQYINRVREGRSDHKAQIDKKIQELLTLAKQTDPLELLAAVAVQNAFADPEKYTESTHKGKECYIEYAQGLLMGLSASDYSFKRDREGLTERFIQLIDEVHNDVLWYFGSEIAEQKKDGEKEAIRFQSIGRFLYVRGDSYPEHHTELIMGLFEEHDHFLVKHFGFTTRQILNAVKEIENQVLVQVNKQIQFLLKLHRLHEMFKQFVDKKGVDSFESDDDLKKQYHALPEVQAESAELEILHKGLLPNPFQLTPNSKLPKQLLDLLSACFGDNQAFVTFHKSPGWPTNDSIVFEKPLIRHNGEYYCFGPQILFRNIGNILESWLEKVDNDYFNGSYQKRRSAYLEQKSMDYFARALPRSEVYPKLYYNAMVNGIPKRCETDGIIIFDTQLFIIEAKAGSLSLSARRGGLERTMGDLKELVDGAYTQANRTLAYIKSNATPTFEDEQGNTVLKIDDKSSIKHTYLVNVTLANLSHLAIQLNSLKQFNLIQGGEWPWSVFINDLRIISEIVESPSIFLHFLQRRITANDYPQFEAADELDFFMYYLHDGLYLQAKYYQQFDLLGVTGYTEDLDRYYDFLAGRVSSGEKPILEISDEYKRLVSLIEATGKLGFTDVTTVLLDFDHNTHSTIIEWINKARAESKSDGRDHDLTMYFKELNLGLMLSVGINRKPTFWKDIDEHCYLKLYQTKLEHWILITLNFDQDGKENVDFRIYGKKWEYDETMGPKLKRFKESKSQRHFAAEGKPQRNKLCPCGSGIKYKKCCGN